MFGIVSEAILENLDPSYKTGLDFRDCFGREEGLYKIDLDIWDHSREEKPPF